LFIGSLTFGQTIPKPVGFIADYEKIFTPEQTSQLRKILLDYEKETTIEIAVLTIDSIETDTGDFAQKTAEQWGIGKKGINNGLLILISKSKHVLRTQTGYGLEGYLPDGWLKHIGDSIASNYKGKYYEGTVELINKCKQRIGKEGYSQDHNKELIKQNKKKSEDLSPIEWMLKHMSWWWLLVVFG
jgi:uncharacterized protein